MSVSEKHTQTAALDMHSCMR